MSDQYRVLAIDDEKDILDLIALTLSDHFEVLTLQDPVDALETLNDFEPDILVLDIMMPKITGYQILELVRQNPKHQNILVVVLSAKDSNLDVKYGYRLGANLYLTKPFQTDRLLKNIQMLAASLGKPRKKTLSLRDVLLRRQLRLKQRRATTSPSDPTATPTPESATPSSGFRLRRPLAQEAEEQENKKWVD